MISSDTNYDPNSLIEQPLLHNKIQYLIEEGNSQIEFYYETQNPANSGFRHFPQYLGDWNSLILKASYHLHEPFKNNISHILEINLDLIEVCFDNYYDSITTWIHDENDELEEILGEEELDESDELLVINGSLYNELLQLCLLHEKLCKDYGIDIVKTTKEEYPQLLYMLGHYYAQEFYWSIGYDNEESVNEEFETLNPDLSPELLIENSFSYYTLFIDGMFDRRDLFTFDELSSGLIELADLCIADNLDDAEKVSNILKDFQEQYTQMFDQIEDFDDVNDESELNPPTKAELTSLFEEADIALKIAIARLNGGFEF